MSTLKFYRYKLDINNLDSIIGSIKTTLYKEETINTKYLKQKDKNIMSDYKIGSVEMFIKNHYGFVEEDGIIIEDNIDDLVKLLNT